MIQKFEELCNNLLVKTINKNVLIIGCPASGKTYLSNKLQSDNHKIIHSDDYMKYGYKEALYVILEDFKKLAPHTKTIIEGVQGYRLLRKGVELGCYYPDIVIELKISETQMLTIYKNERKDKKASSLTSFNNMHSKILNDYYKMANSKKPLWITINNEY